MKKGIDFRPLVIVFALIVFLSSLQSCAYEMRRGDGCLGTKVAGTGGNGRYAFRH